jgi:hypothetical protein
MVVLLPSERIHDRVSHSLDEDVPARPLPENSGERTMQPCDRACIAQDDPRRLDSCGLGKLP